MTGEMVLYTLNEHDAEAINARRAAMARDAGTTPGRIGNEARRGDEYPALVVREFTPGSSVVNLQVFLDGYDTYWATSRGEAEEAGPGRWVRRA